VIVRRSGVGRRAQEWGPRLVSIPRRLPPGSAVASWYGDEHKADRKVESGVRLAPSEGKTPGRGPLGENQAGARAAAPGELGQRPVSHSRALPGLTCAGPTVSADTRR
jgi:hypothetical protein